MPLFRKFAGFFKAAGLSIRRRLLGGAAAAVYIEEVFSTYLYTGTGAAQNIINGVALDYPNEQAYLVPGTYSWICPTGVTSVSVVCIGGGETRGDQSYGGGGGGLGYKNNISVTPGTTYTVVVGAAGGSSTFGASVVGASGGSNSQGGTPLYSSTGFNGGAGGGDNIGDYGGFGGGGGAASLTANGGNGGTYGGQAATGNGGGASIGGGGSSVYGTSGTSSGYYGGANYGGGGAGGQGTQSGGTGAVRIIWSGSTRQFPSTNITPQTNDYRGGLVWTKPRNAVGNNILASTSPTFNSTKLSTLLVSNSSNGFNTSDSNAVRVVTGDGFSIGSSTLVNNSGTTYTSYTFRQVPKFFNMTEFTTNLILDEVGYPIGGGDATVTHSLGSTPGFIMVKSMGTGSWYCWHRSLGDSNYVMLDSTSSSSTGITWSVSSTQFNVSGLPNWGSGHVAYIFAHNAGGFGLTGTDNVISCGSVAVTGSAQSVSLGYEPQWILWKKSSGTDNWWMFDTMRGLVVDGGSGTGDKYLYANSSAAEAGTYGIDPTATGFQLSAGWGAGDYIYIAIRRGPMKVPTDATKVFSPTTYTGNGTSGRVLSSIEFPPDSVFYRAKNTAGSDNILTSKLSGIAVGLATNSNGAQGGYNAISEFGQNSITVTSSANINGSSSYNYINYYFKRAPGFHDIVCYTGAGNFAQSVNHNLGVVPELTIIKCRSSANYGEWQVALKVSSTHWWLGNLYQTNQFVDNGDLSAYATSTIIDPWNLMSGSGYPSVNGETYVAYLFATCAGVSKVGSYTGTATTLQVDCGFTGGARFVLIKRIDSAGAWYVWDSARGIIAGNDPYLLLNSTAVEVSNTDYIDPYSPGFELSSTAPAALNASGGTYIFLAIA
jgi:hypothetical protein